MKVNKSHGPIRVLIIDDEKDIRDASERILTRAGFEAYKASRGEEGLKIVKKDSIAIVLLDLKMPGMDGIDVLQKIRSLDESIHVIVITGFATVETAIEAMKLGAYDFIPKPFEPDQLRITINRAVEKIHLQQEAIKLERERKRTLTDLDTEKSRIHTILTSLPYGVVVTNTRAQVVLMNTAFKQLLNLAPDIKSGQEIENYIPDKELCSLIREISKGIHVDYDDLSDYEFTLSNGNHLLAKGQPVKGEQMECLGTVVNVVDVTSMRVLDKLKSEFVAKVSHELRSPLSTIHEQLAIVIRDMVGDKSESDHHILSRAQEKTRGLISLIGDLLDLSRIEEGLILQNPKPVKLDDLLKNVVDFLKIRAENKHQTLKLILPEKPIPAINADPIALESIFGNLIANAINYTGDGGTITATADLAGINIRIKIADDGFGIEAKYLDKIFERFYRVKDEKTRYITGTGLGLPIVKGLVDSLDGFIEVESTPGQGSVFTVLLPLKD